MTDIRESTSAPKPHASALAPGSMNSTTNSHSAASDKPAQAAAWSGVLTPGLLVGFLGVVVVLVATLFVGLANLRSVYSTSAGVAHSYAVKAGLEQLLLTLTDGETGERGFVITGNASYLEPYDRARREVSPRIAQLRTLTAENREQQADLDRVSAAAELKLGELADAIRQRRESGFAAAQAAVADDVGQRIMDEMRVIVARMEAREDALLAARTEQATQSYRAARWTRFVTTGLALLVVVVLFFSTRRFGAERLRGSETEERLRVTLASIGDAVIATDDQGRVMRMNAVAEALTGWTEADAAGRRLEDVFVIINEMSRRPAESPIGKVLRDRVIVGLANHTVLISKDGREIPVDDSAAPIKTAEGQVTGVVMVFRDVSERRRVEQERETLVEAERLARVEAEAAERRLRVALEAGHMGTWQWSVGTGALKWSPGLEAIHGYAPGAFPGSFEAFQREVHPDDRDRVFTTIAQGVEQRRDHHIEYRIVRPDGGVRWVEGRGQLFCHADGSPDRMVGVCSDVTERKQAEERFRLAIEAAPTAMIVVDRHGIITYVNALTEPLFGYSRHEIVGTTIDQLVPARFRDRHEEYRRGFAADARQRAMGAGRDLYMLRKDGSEVSVEIGLSPFETGDGVFTVAAVTDVTERRRLLDSERLAKREAEQANRTKDEFLATVSHELRTPLNAIQGWARMLRLGQVAPAKVDRALESVERNTAVLTDLVSDLLDVSRIVAGKLHLEMQPVDLGATVRQAVEALRGEADTKRVRLNIETAGVAAAIHGDPLRLQQIVTNLVSNAIKFTPPEGHIGVGLAAQDGRVKLIVKDTGQGIAPDALSYIFDRFRQGSPHGDPAGRSGLGLGLAIVRHLVELHGGSVIAESSGEGLGATFTVDLPRPAPDVSAEHPDDAPVRWRTEKSGSVPRLSGLRVLIVDQHGDSREMMAATLRSYGADVVAVASAREALGVATASTVHALVSDLSMARADSHELIARLQEMAQDRRTPPIPAIAVMAYADSKNRAVPAGFQTYLVKPYDPRELAEAVARVAGLPV